MEAPNFLRTITFLFIAAALSVNCVCAENREVTIGASIPLSGKLAATGDHQQKAISLALEEINSGPVRLRVIFDDNGGEPAKAASGVTKLISVDKVDVVFSVFSHIVLAVRDIVKRSGRIFLYMAGTSKPLQDSSRVFKDWSEASDQALVLARAVQLGNHRTVAVLSEANEICEDVMATFAAEASARNYTILAVEHYNSGETDFRSLLLRVAAQKPQALVLCDFRDAGVIMRQYNELRLMNIPTIHAFAPFVPESDTPEVRALYEKNHARSAWIDFVEGSLSPKQKAFAEKFHTRYGIEPRLEAVFMYDDMFFLEKAVATCFKSGLDQECLAKNLQTMTYDGVGGPLQFGDSRRSHRKTTLIEVKDGRWQDVPLK